MSASKKRSKKQILRQHIASAISKNLVELKEALGDKKFNRNVKKASKVLVSGFPKKVKEVKKKSELVTEPVNAN